MDHINAIKKHLGEQNYYSALFLAVMIPSICGALESDNGRDNEKRYKAWFKKYVKTVFFTPDDCYQLRCSLLHRGSTHHPNSQWKKIIFTVPIPGGSRVHDSISNNALLLDIPIFCKQLTDASEQWLKQVKESSNFKKNLDRMIKFHTNGMPPHIIGQPVIS